jgi:hypothetical protein
MAKGQKRSNREAKKPKQAKPKAATAQTTFSAKLEASQDRARGSKK